MNAVNDLAEKIICNRGKSECSHKFGGNINLEMGMDVLVLFTAESSRVWTWNTAAFAIRCRRLLSTSRPNSLALKQWA